MMTEHNLTGYCRVLHTAREEEVEVENRKLDECDCCYGNCKFQSQCTIAEKIGELIAE